MADDVIKTINPNIGTNTNDADSERITIEDVNSDEILSSWLIGG